MAGRGGGRPGLQQHHSHFIMVEDPLMVGTGNDQFGLEMELRDFLEVCMTQNCTRSPFDKGPLVAPLYAEDPLYAEEQERCPAHRARFYAEEQELTGQQIQRCIDGYMRVKHVRWASFTPDSQRCKHVKKLHAREDNVPLVRVCVNGGPGSAYSLLKSVENGVLSG